MQITLLRRGHHHVANSCVFMVFLKPKEQKRTVSFKQYCWNSLVGVTLKHWNFISIIFCLDSYLDFNKASI